MIFPYQEDRPSLTFQLKSKDKWKYFTALIDSGADFSIFPYVSPLIGRQGFFDTFKVIFDQKKKVTILKSF